MFEIKPNAFYSRADLAKLLEPAGVDVDTFIGRLRPRKVFHRLFFGEDLIEAMRRAPALAEREEADNVELPAPPKARRGARRKTRSKAASGSATTLDGYLHELKRKS